MQCKSTQCMSTGVGNGKAAVAHVQTEAKVGRAEEVEKPVSKFEGERGHCQIKGHKKMELQASATSMANQLVSTRWQRQARRRIPSKCVEFGEHDASRRLSQCISEALRNEVHQQDRSGLADFHGCHVGFLTCVDMLPNQMG